MILNGSEIIVECLKRYERKEGEDNNVKDIRF